MYFMLSRAIANTAKHELSVRESIRFTRKVHAVSFKELLSEPGLRVLRALIVSIHIRYALQTRALIVISL